MSHVRDHCDKPNISKPNISRRHWRHDGMVWACSCGQMYRVARTWGEEGYCWNWTPVDPKTSPF